MHPCKTIHITYLIAVVAFGNEIGPKLGLRAYVCDIKRLGLDERQHDDLFETLEPCLGQRTIRYTLHSTTCLKRMENAFSTAFIHASQASQEPTVNDLLELGDVVMNLAVVDYSIDGDEDRGVDLVKAIENAVDAEVGRCRGPDSACAEPLLK